MSKRVYKFTKASHAIGSLRDKRLKLSTINGLNDPFDLCPLDTTDKAISNALDAVIIHFRRTAAILCFSRNWDNLLLWSHYPGTRTRAFAWVLTFPTPLPVRTTIRMSSSRPARAHGGRESERVHARFRRKTQESGRRARIRTSGDVEGVLEHFGAGLEDG